jgi:hypothetical protein
MQCSPAQVAAAVLIAARHCYAKALLRGGRAAVLMAAMRYALLRTPASNSEPPPSRHHLTWTVRLESGPDNGSFDTMARRWPCYFINILI